jgi:methionyl aminopeptidase
MLYYKTEAEIEKIRTACHLVCKTIAHVGSLIKPGISGIDLDKEAEIFLLDHGAKPAFKGYRGFPNTLTVSVNEQVVHGIPGSVEFKDGDIISVDCGSELDGFFGDAAYTFALGEVKPEVMRLCVATNRSLYRGIEQAISGKRTGDIAFAIWDYCERANKYGVVRELVGHGLGRSLHEEPDVPNYGRKGQGILMREGLVIAIEPMVNMGSRDIRQKPDGWTIYTKDGRPAAHYEHSVVVRRDKAEILSDHSYIEAAIKKNIELKEIV